MLTSDFIIKQLNNRSEKSNLILFSLGKLVSVFGSTIFTFAIGLYVLKLTGSGLSFATTLVLGIVPRVIIYPFAGVLADKLDKKTMVVLMDLANGVLFIGLFILSSAYGLNLPMIYATTFIMTVITCFFGVSFEAAIPNIVTDKMLMNINSVSRIIDSLSSILGPMIGGMIYAFMDIRFFIIINGISFILSGISEMFINFKFNHTEEAEPQEAKIDFIKDIKEGFIYLIQNKKLFSLFGIFVALNFFIGFSATVPLPFIINNILKLSSAEFGIIEGAFPAGMILGALSIKRISERFSYKKILMGTSCLLSLCIVMAGAPTLFSNTLLTNVGYVIYYCAVMLIFGTAISFIDIPIAYMMQTSIPDEFRGRVTSIGISLAKIASPVALVLSGIVINFIPAYIVTSVGGVLLLAFILVSAREGSSKNAAA